jgi:uncharacterized protein YwqG
MSPSIVKVVDADKDHSNLVLTVKSIKGKPKEGEAILLKYIYGEYFIVIMQILPMAFDGQFKMILDDHAWAWTPTMQEQIIGSVFLCGLTYENYMQLPVKERKDYFVSIAEFVGGSQIHRFIKDHILSAINLVPTEAENIKSLTKLGGLPIATKGFTFPKGKNNQSALFLLQIDLAELKQRFETAKQIKGQGILYFFGTVKADYSEYRSFDNIIVRYTEEIDELLTVSLPEDLLQYGVFEEKVVLAVETVSIPASNSEISEAHGIDQMSSYWELENMLRYLYDYRELELDDLILLGHTHDVQGGIVSQVKRRQFEQGQFSESSNTKISKEPDEYGSLDEMQWRPLLQLETSHFRRLSNSSREFNQFLDGVFYVMIKQSDLEQMNFDTETIYQST